MRLASQNDSLVHGLHKNNRNLVVHFCQVSWVTRRVSQWAVIFWNESFFWAIGLSSGLKMLSKPCCKQMCCHWDFFVPFRAMTNIIIMRNLKYNTSRLFCFRVATDLKFVKDSVSAKCSETKYDYFRSSQSSFHGRGTAPTKVLMMKRVTLFQHPDPPTGIKASVILSWVTSLGFFLNSWKRSLLTPF